jgi:sugar phosphate isomerase/epimerase
VKLAYSTNGFARVNLPTAIRRIAAHGYTGVELLADEPHWSPGLSAFDLAAVRTALNETGLTISNVNANTAMVLWPQVLPETVFEPSLSNHDPAVRARRLSCVGAAMDFAAAVGATTISVTSGRPETDYTPEESMAYFAESLAEVCSMAEARRLEVGIEYEPGLLVESAAEVRALIDAVDHPALGANLDIGHAICAGEDPLESIKLLAGRIWNVHLEDIKGRKHYHLVPGDGDVDFAAVIAGLTAAGYDRFGTVELYTFSKNSDEAAARAHAYLAPLVAQVASL